MWGSAHALHKRDSMAASLSDQLLTITGLAPHTTVARRRKTPNNGVPIDGAHQSWSLALMAKVAADEAVCAIRRMLMRSFSREDWQRISHEVSAAAQAY